MACEDRLDAFGAESILNNTGRGLDRVSPSPVTWRHVYPKLGNLRLPLARSKPAAADMLTGSQKEDWPILNAVCAPGLQLSLQSGLHFVRRVAVSRDVPRDGGISPEIGGEVKI